MNIFLYLDRDTWVQRLDPRTKMIGLLILFALCLYFNHPLYMAGVSGGILAIAISARALPNLGRLRVILILLFVFSALMWPFFARGPTPFMVLGSFHRQPGIFAVRDRHGAKAGLFCDYRAHPPLDHPERRIDQRPYPPGNSLSRSFCLFNLPETHPDPCGRRRNDHSGPDIQGAGSRIGKHLPAYGKVHPPGSTPVSVRDPLYEPIGHRPGIQGIQSGVQAHAVL